MMMRMRRRSRRRRTRIVVGAVVVGVMTFGSMACSLLLDSDDLSTPPSASRTDAGNAAADGAADRDTVNNGDGAGGDSATTTSLCDATFCESFDKGSTTSSSLTQWPKVELTAGGMLDLSTSQFRSPPNSLRGRITSTSGSTYPNALIFHDVAPGARIACEMSLFVVSLPNVAFVDVLSLQTKTPDFDYELWFGFSSTGATFRDDVVRKDGGCDCPLKDVFPPTPPTNKWIRVRMETDFKIASLSYDGAIVHSSEYGGGFAPSNSLTVVTGIRGYPNQQAEVLIDDLICTVR